MPVGFLFYNFADCLLFGLAGGFISFCLIFTTYS